MKSIAKTCVVALALALGDGVSAQDLYKCKDAAGRITYSGKECSMLGLTSAGEVKGRASISSAPKLQPPPKSPAPAASAAAPPAPAPASESAPKEPQRRCFAVKGGTRCNDDPGKSD